MKKLLIAGLLGFFSLAGFAQGVRVDPLPSSTVNGVIPGGYYPPLLVIPGTVVTLCNYPASGFPCTNFATSYTDASLTSACPSGSPVVPNGSLSCTNVADAAGKFGFWVAAGNYTFTLTNPTSGQVSGPFAFSAGGAGGVPAGVVLLAPSGSQTITQNVNGSTVLGLSNNDAGASASTVFALSNGTDNFYMALGGTGNSIPGAVEFAATKVGGMFGLGTNDGPVLVQTGNSTITLNGALNFSTDTGTANAYITNVPLCVDSVFPGQIGYFTAANASTGPSTFVWCASGSPVTLYKNGSTNLGAGDIIAGGLYAVIYDGTNWQLLNSSLVGGGSSGFPIHLGSTSIASGSTTTAIAGLTLTTSSINGVTLSTAGPATEFLNHLGGYSVPAGSGSVGSFAAPSASWPPWLVPTVVNGTTAPSLSVAASAIPNAALANSSTTVNGVTCTLGSTCTTGASNISGGVAQSVALFGAATTITGPAAISDNGTTIAITEPVNITTPSGNGISWVEGIPPSGVALSDQLWPDSASHAWKMNNNNGGAQTVIGSAGGTLTGALTAPSVILPGSTSGQITILATATAGTQTITFPAASGAVSLTGAEVVTFSATPTFSASTTQSRIVLTGNITSFTMGAGASGSTKMLCFKQGAGSYTVNPPSNVHGFFASNSGNIGTVNGDWNCQLYSYDGTDAIWLATSGGVVNE